MSEGSNAVVWQCVHCHEVLSGVPPGSLRYCPFCSRPQQPPQRTLCVNPDCREQLFTPTVEACHKCNASQQTPVKQQQTAPPGSHSPDNRQLRTSTQTDLSQPPSTIPGAHHSVPEQKNISRNGDSFEGESDDTDDEKFFDAPSELSQVQVAGSNNENFLDATSELQQMQAADSHLVGQHTQLPPSPLPHPTQSSSPPQPSQHLTGATSYLEHPPSSGTFNSQPPGSETHKEPTQEATSNSAPLQGQEPGNQIQLSTTQLSPKKLDSITADGKQSSTLAKHTTAPPECTTSTAETPKPPSESTGITDHPIASHVGGNSEGLHGQKRTDEQRLPDDKSQTDLPEPHEKHKGHANGNGELLSQDTTTPPENTTSTTETPGLTSAHDHPLASDFKASKGSQKQTKELSSADKWQMKDNDDNPSTDPHGLHEQQDSDVANGNGELSSTLSKDTTSTTPLKAATTDSNKPLPDASGVPDHPGIASEDDGASEANERSQQTTKTDTPAKLSKHEQNKEDTRKELIGKAVDSKQERTPPSQRHVLPKQKPTTNANANSTDPISQPASQQMGGSRTGSVTHTALTRLV